MIDPLELDDDPHNSSSSSSSSSESPGHGNSQTILSTSPTDELCTEDPTLLSFEYCEINGAANTSVTKDLSFETVNFHSSGNPSQLGIYIDDDDDGLRHATKREPTDIQEPEEPDLKRVKLVDDEFRETIVGDESEKLSIDVVDESIMKPSDLGTTSIGKPLDTETVVDDSDDSNDATDDSIAEYEEHVRTLDVQASSQRMCISDEDDDDDDDDHDHEDVAANVHSESQPSPDVSTNAGECNRNLSQLADLTQCFDPDGIFTQELYLQLPATQDYDRIPTELDIEQSLEQFTVQKAKQLFGQRPAAMLPPSAAVHRKRLPPPTFAPPPRDFYAGPLPLFIEDLQRHLAPALQQRHHATAFATKTGARFHLFGHSFASVALYGRCCVQTGRSRRPNDTSGLRYYDVDDGTGTVAVAFAHTDERRRRRLQSINQTATDLYAMRRDMDKQMYGRLAAGLRAVRAREPAHAEEAFRTGANVLVLGRPYWDAWRRRLAVWAHDMWPDDGRSRDFELAFKGNLAAMYEQRHALADVHS